MPGVAITYLVDPDTRTFDKRIHQIESHGDRAPSTVQDIRRVLDDKNVDVVSIATPNHWHALMTIWAAQAGKDVYVEKPCSHNIHEGRIAALAARRYSGSYSMERRAGRARNGPWPRPRFGRGSWASCWSLERSATSRVARSASSRAPRLLPRLISTSGSARRPSRPIMPTWSTTTGTGSGISATATSATKESIRWTSPAG